MSNAITPAQLKAAIACTAALAEAVRDLGRVHAGHLYATVMHVLDLPAFNHIVGLMVEAGAVERQGHELIWKGAPKP